MKVYADLRRACKLSPASHYSYSIQWLCTEVLRTSKDAEIELRLLPVHWLELLSPDALLCNAEVGSTQDRDGSEKWKEEIIFVG